MTFLGNPPNGSRVDTYGETDRQKDGRTDKRAEGNDEHIRSFRKSCESALKREISVESLTA